MEIVFRDAHISFRDYATMNRKYLMRKQKLRLLLLPVLFLLITLVNFYNNSKAIEQRAGTGVNWMYLVGIAVVLAWVAFSMRRTWRKQYDRTLFLQSPATYTFSDQGVTVSSSTVQGTNAWEVFDTLLLMNELAVLTTRNLTVFFLNFRYLEAPATKADFIALVQRHGVSVK